MIFQPIMPFKLTKDMKLLTRPTVPIIFSTPVPTGLKPDGTAYFDDMGGLGDISLPLFILTRAETRANLFSRLWPDSSVSHPLFR
jgi:hypothetical protein